MPLMMTAHSLENPDSLRCMKKKNCLHKCENAAGEQQTCGRTVPNGCGLTDKKIKLKSRMQKSPLFEIQVCWGNGIPK